MKKEDYIGNRERCSECGALIINTRFEYVLRPKQDEKIIKRLFERKLEEYICPECGKLNVKRVNTLEYIDDSKYFKIFFRRQSGSLMKIYRDLISEESNNNPIDFFGGEDDSNNYRYYGVTDLDEVITAICAFENDLDIKVVWLVLHDLAKQLDKDDKGGLVIYGLTYDNEHNLVCEFKEKDSDEHIFNRFPMKRYEEYKEKYSEQLKPKLEFDFGYQAAINFFKNLDKEELSEKETRFAITNNGVLALVPNYIGELKTGDVVVVNDDNYVKYQKVTDVFTLSNKTINFNYEEVEFPFVQNIGKPLILNEMLSEEDVEENKDLCEQLNTAAETEKFKDFPYADLLDKTIYVPCTKSDDDELLPMIKDGAAAVFVSNKLKIHPNFMKIKFRDFKKYLEMYANPEVIEGIVFVHTGKKDITFLSMSAIFEAPIRCLMESEDTMKIVLDSLDSKYKKYLTYKKEEDAYKAIRFMYFNNHENKQFEIAQKELGVNEATIHKMLDFGYVRLQRIVRSAF